MKKIIPFIFLFLIVGCSILEKDPQECLWSNSEKEIAWKNTKYELKKTDGMAEDFYHFSKPASELKFWEEEQHCTLVPPINPNPKGAYLDGGVFVYLDKTSQSVLKVVPIAW